MLQRFLPIALCLVGTLACSTASPDEEVAVDEPTTRGAVMFVVSGHTDLGETGVETGFFLSEVAHPWRVLTDAGYTVDFVSPAGGKVQMDPKSHDLDDPINVAFLASADAKELTGTLKPEAVDPTQYSAIFYAGGHGAMWDFPGSEALAGLAAQIWDNGGVVAAVCHGPAGLVNIKLADGSYLVDGKRLTAFTNAEEAAVKLTDTVPFLLATTLEERGATHVPAPNFAEHVVVDGRLVTGQNPASATEVGRSIVKLLSL